METYELKINNAVNIHGHFTQTLIEQSLCQVTKHLDIYTKKSMRRNMDR